MTCFGPDSALHHVANLGALTRGERKEVAKRSWMFEGHGTLPRQPVHGGKDLGPGIAWQQVGKFIQRAGADLSELLVDRRFDHIYLHPNVLSP